MANQGKGREYYSDAVLIGDSTKGAITVPTTRARALVFVNTGTGTCTVRVKDKDGNDIAISMVGALNGGDAAIVPLATSIVGSVIRGGLGGTLSVYELY